MASFLKLSALGIVFFFFLFFLFLVIYIYSDCHKERSVVIFFFGLSLNRSVNSDYKVSLYTILPWL